MSSREEQEHISRTRPQEELESPFLAEELFVEESGDEWEARLTALELESPFQTAFEQDQTSRIEPEDLEETFEFDDEGDYSAEEGFLAEEAKAGDELDLTELEEEFDDEDKEPAEVDFLAKESEDEGELALAELGDDREDQFAEDWIESKEWAEGYAIEESMFDEEAAYPPEELAYEEDEQFLDEEISFEQEGIWSLLSSSAIGQRVRQFLGEGLFGFTLLSGFASGQIWNEDHLALEVLFNRNPQFRPSKLDTISGSTRVNLLFSLAEKYKKDLTPIRERIIRPVFGNPANFQIGPATGCQIVDMRQEVFALGPLRGGKSKRGGYWYKRDKRWSPRKKEVIDSIVLHHMAYNIGNDVNLYKKVGAHYIVTADGQIAKLYDDLDFLNSSNGFNKRCVAIEFAGNFPTDKYHWWRDRKSKRTIPDRCYLTPAQIRSGRCLLADIKNRLPDIKYLYAHRQSSESRENDPGLDVWFNIGEWALKNLHLTDRLPQTHIGNGRPIPEIWRMNRSSTLAKPDSLPPSQPSGITVPEPKQSSSPSGKKLTVTANTLNVRSSPSLNANKIGLVRKNDIVDWLDSSADGKWFKIRKDTLVGWSYFKFFSQMKSSGSLDRIMQVATDSEIAHYRWRDRGRAPRGYIKGMALVYARVYCKLKAGDAAAGEMAKANTGNPDKDALAHYAQEFKDVGMANHLPGNDTLRHLFVLLIGLGMRESSGRYCEGRDKSATNVKADTAEAGLFQTSFNMRTANPLLRQLFSQYLANPAGFEDVFREGISCRDSDLENFGEGEGREFQRLSKKSPAFAAEFTAVGLRNRRKHWGPINRKSAEIRPECDAMLQQVEKIVDEFNLCQALA